MTKKDFFALVKRAEGYAHPNMEGPVVRYYHNPLDRYGNGLHQTVLEAYTMRFVVYTPKQGDLHKVDGIAKKYREMCLRAVAKYQRWLDEHNAKQAEAVRDLWKRACSDHLKPSRLLRLAIGLAAPEADDSVHLESCSQCRSVFGAIRWAQRKTTPCPRHGSTEGRHLLDQVAAKWTKVTRLLGCFSRRILGTFSFI